MRAFMKERGHGWAIYKPYRGTPCPFLNANNECLIYETRPQICRDYPQGIKCIKEMQNICS